MKKYSVKEILLTAAFFGGFLAGILFTDLWGNTYLKENTFLSPENLVRVARQEIDTQALFFYLLKHRGKCALLLWLLGYTVVGIPAALLALVWIGCSAGVFLSLFVVHMHLMGVLMFLAAVLPQALFYGPMVWLLVLDVYDRCAARYKSRRLSAELFRDSSGAKRFALLLALFLAGVVLESSINPWLLTQAVNYFL
ncbi:MAG: stage II sporulation protein M [Eubacteriales bacterium]|nr:stage II sporulation protein M [Eubacteriales bacterium]